MPVTGPKEGWLQLRAIVSQTADDQRNADVSRDGLLSRISSSDGSCQQSCAVGGQRMETALARRPGDELSRILMAYLPDVTSSVLTEAFNLCDWDNSGWIFVRAR